MGVRTRNHSQQNSVERIFAEGNTVRVEVISEPAVIRLPRERTERQKQVSQKVRRQKALLAVTSVLAAVVLLVALCVTMLNISGENSGLKKEISALESSISELKSQNDSKEYDLNCSVDLNYVVQVATGDMGMVRSSSGQIRTYNSSASEYVQQVAEIPTD
ncbi:MAG: hypothetical protein MJ086_01185 [Lachnospiraceae bacterium]|nr:hypothetical protein [Lachnospiraceae bacterium]